MKSRAGLAVVGVVSKPGICEVEDLVGGSTLDGWFVGHGGT